MTTKLSSMNIPCFASAVPVVYHNHPGYLRYLNDIEKGVPAYNASKQNRKWHVIRDIIVELQEEDREFLFLNKDGTWTEYSETHVHSRTTNLMRQFVRYHEDGIPIGEKDIPIVASTVPATLQNHPGYVAYLDLVQSYVQTYSTAKPNHKVLVLRDVLDKMKEREMRFVKMDTTLNTWVESEDKEIVLQEKIRTLIKMYQKLFADDAEQAVRSRLNDSTVEDDVTADEYIASPVSSSRKSNVPNIINHNSNEDQDDTSVSSGTNTINSDDDEVKKSVVPVASKKRSAPPIPLGGKRILLGGKRLPSMKKSRKTDGAESPNDESSEEAEAPFPLFNSSLSQIIQVEVKRQLKRSPVMKNMEAKIKKLEQEAILHNQQKVKMEEKIEELQSQVEAFHQQMGFQD